MYNITRKPKHGLLLKAQGEKTAEVFSQKDIDEQKIYFIPTNYSAYEVTHY